MQVKVWLIFGYVNQRAQPNKSMDARRKQLLSFGVVRYPDVACIRFPPASSPPLDASCLKTQSTADLKTEPTRSAFPAKLRDGKRRAKDEDASNKSMDVRAKQRLCYRVVRCLLR